MLGESFIGEKIKLPGGRVSFDLPIPPGMVVFNEPLTQPRERLIVETLDLLLNLFNAAHAVLRSTPILAQTSRGAERRGSAARIFPARPQQPAGSARWWLSELARDSILCMTESQPSSPASPAGED